MKNLLIAAAALTLAGGAVAGAVVGGVFGLVRALPVLSLRHVHTSGQLTAAARRVEALAPAGRRAATAALAVVAGGAAVQAVATGTGMA